MPRVLVNLELDSAELLSVVDKGASGNARVSPRIVLVKRRTEPMSILKRLLGTKVRLEKADGSIEVKTPEQMLQEAIADLPEEKQNVVLAAVAAMGAAMQPAQPTADVAKPKPEEEEEAKVTKALEKMTPEGRALIEQVAKANKDLVAKVEEMAKKLDDADKRIEKSEAEKRGSRFAEVAKSMPHVPGEMTAIAKVLDEADAKLSPESAKALVETLSKANKLIAKSGLLQETGSALSAGGASAIDQINELARKRLDEVRKSSTGRKYTIEMAKAEVTEEHPELYAEYLEETGRGRRRAQ